MRNRGRLVDGWWMGLPGRALGVVLWGGIWCEPRYHHVERRAGTWVANAPRGQMENDSRRVCAVPGGGGADGLENMLEYTVGPVD